MAYPKVKFLLVGVTRVKDHDFARNSGGEIEAGEMLGGLEDYKKRGKIPGKYDVVYLMTGLDMIKYANGRNGVNTLAHELAHTLGSDHDETPECPWADGYLMSYVDGGLRKFRLSQCSENSIRQYVRKLSDECIQVLNARNLMKDENKFPGQTIRAQFFCKKQGRQNGQRGKGQRVIVKQDADCNIQCCYRYVGYMTCAKYKMLDGMKCLPGKTCRRGICGKH
ncbi:hypothetical protein MTO96_033113 [Rhipicephalus appendiculatus]